MIRQHLPFLKSSSYHLGPLIRRLSTANSAVYDFLVHKHHFSPKSATKIASSVVRLTNPKRSDSVLSFLKQTGLSIPQLEKAVKLHPPLLNADVEKTVKPKLKFLQDMGFSSADVAQIISNGPRLLESSVTNRITPSLSVLQNLLGSWSSKDAPIVLKAYSQLLRVNLDKRVIPNVELLKKCGAPMDKIINIMGQQPRFLFSQPEKMKEFVAKAEAMGCSKSSRTFVVAVRVIGSHSDEAWEMKLRAFRGLGFSDDDIAKAFRSYPVVFSLSEKRVKEVIEVIVGSGKYDISCIVRYPACLESSIDNRVKPRMQVLELLEGKNLIQSWPPLYQFYRSTDRKFYDKFVGPFLDEIGDDMGKRWGNV